MENRGMRALLRNDLFRQVLIITLVILALKAISVVTGLGAWIDSNSTAWIAYQLFGLLLFGAVDLASLLMPTSSEDGMRPFFLRLSGIFFLCMAAIFGWALITGQNATDLFS